MTMFRKVFGNHVAANREELRVMEATPHPDDEPPKMPPPVPQSAEPVKVSEQPKQPEPVSKSAELEDIALTQRAASLAERAAAVEKQMEKSQTHERPKPAVIPSTPAVDRLAQVAPSEVTPQPAPRPKPKSAARARTRLLGFDAGADDQTDPFARATEVNSVPKQRFPAGWLVIAQGPGRGEHFPVFHGAAMVGRGEDQAIRLDFGDNAISRQNHAAIAYDLEDNKFYLGHGGKSNIIRLNDRPVLSTETLCDGDMIRIGETTLRFVALCGENFQWGQLQDD